jgi:hypothetical protein
MQVTIAERIVHPEHFVLGVLLDTTKVWETADKVLELTDHMLRSKCSD